VFGKGNLILHSSMLAHTHTVVCSEYLGTVMCAAHFWLVRCVKIVENGKICRDVTDSESVSEFDGIRLFFRNPKSDGYLKSNRVGFEIANC